MREKLLREGEVCEEEGSVAEMSVSIPRQSSYSMLNKHKTERVDWVHLFPSYMTHILIAFRSPEMAGRIKCLYYSYYVATIITFFTSLIFPLISSTTSATEAEDVNTDASSEFKIFFYVQFLLYLGTPFYYFHVMKGLAKSKSIPLMMHRALEIRPSAHLKKKFRLIFNFNIVLVTTATVLYLALRDFGIFWLFFTIFWSIIYICPMGIMYSILVCLLEMHRMEADHFKKQLVMMKEDFEEMNEKTAPEQQQQWSDVVRSVDNISRRYCALHDCCRSTSTQFGLSLLLLFLIPITLVVSATWSIYEKFFSLASNLGFIVMALTYLLEIGLTVATTNESGYLVCREMTSYLMRVFVNPPTGADVVQLLSLETINKMNGFIGCLTYLKMDIPFFGNFALSSTALIAIVGSLIGAIIPGIVRFHL